MPARVPTFKGAAASFVGPGVATADLAYLTVFNKAGSGVLVAIRRLSLQTDHVSNTGTIRTWKTTRLTTAPTDGTLLTPQAWDTAGSHSASVEIRGKASVDGTSGTLTATPGTGRATSTIPARNATAVRQMRFYDVDLLPAYPYPEDPLTLREGEGIWVGAAEAGSTLQHFLVNVMIEEFTYAASGASGASTAAVVGEPTSSGRKQGQGVASAASVLAATSSGRKQVAVATTAAATAGSVAPGRKQGLASIAGQLVGGSAALGTKGARTVAGLVTGAVVAARKQASAASSAAIVSGATTASGLPSVGLRTLLAMSSTSAGRKQASAAARAGGVTGSLAAVRKQARATIAALLAGVTSSATRKQATAAAATAGLAAVPSTAGASRRSGGIAAVVASTALVAGRGGRTGAGRGLLASGSVSAGAQGGATDPTRLPPGAYAVVAAGHGGSASSPGGSTDIGTHGGTVTSGNPRAEVRNA